jgi:TonB-linked SusC/RagA family outer membrane protein
MGFFPSIGVGWMVSNENFWQPLLPLFSKLKLRATYGLVGNDNIGNSSERFFYLSNVTMGDAARGYVFGYDFTYWRNGISIKRYSNPDVTWEISRKMNLAAEIGLWNALEIQAEYFTENRSNILQQRADIPVTMGLQQIPYANIGKAAGHGVDVSVDFNKSFNRDTWASMRGNFTYATSKYTEYEEPNYNNANTPWRSHTNRKLSQPFGYIAERLFLDDEEVKNSPDQFENYMAGDIKYRDINGDSKIDENDEVPIGYPTTPEIIYGFGFSTGYKAFDVSIFFQGSARSSFFISANKTAPFVTGDVSGFTTTRAMLKYWADDHWSETDRDILAIWPRLSQTHITNNEKQSTWWMRDGSFLRLKTAELGWSLPEGWTKALKFSNVRLYLSGSNLLLFSKFKMWDVEMAGNGLAYPIQRVFNIGINADF